jgi:hypothetical protein
MEARQCLQGVITQHPSPHPQTVFLKLADDPFCPFASRAGDDDLSNTGPGSTADSSTLTQLLWELGPNGASEVEPEAEISTRNRHSVTGIATVGIGWKRRMADGRRNMAAAPGRDRRYVDWRTVRHARYSVRIAPIVPPTVVAVVTPVPIVVRLPVVRRGTGSRAVRVAPSVPRMVRLNLTHHPTHHQQCHGTPQVRSHLKSPDHVRCGNQLNVSPIKRNACQNQAVRRNWFVAN